MASRRLGCYGSSRWGGRWPPQWKMMPPRESPLMKYHAPELRFHLSQSGYGGGHLVRWTGAMEPWFRTREHRTLLTWASQLNN